MKDRIRFGQFIPFLLLPLLLTVHGCSSGGGARLQGASAASAKLIKAPDAAALEKKLKDELIRRYDRVYYYPFICDTLPERGATLTTGGAAGGAVDHSDTNTQEKGVDEGDLVKTDGASIFMARGTHFLVLKAQPADQTAIISDIDLSEYISELYLVGQRVVIISHSSTRVSSLTGIWLNSRQTTRVRFYDVGNPASPVLAADYRLPGGVTGSRRINNTIYFITNYTVDLPSPVSPWDYLEGTDYDQEAYLVAAEKARAENLRLVRETSLQDLLPTYSRTLHGANAGQVTGPAVDTADIYIPEPSNGTDLSLVFAIDATLGNPGFTSTGILTSSGTVYMSSDALYLASTNRWLWLPIIIDETQPANPEPQTVIHKFVVGGAGQPTYRGSGAVGGWLNNQFSMGEHQGYLRVGTTLRDSSTSETNNRLTILTEKDEKLVETGRLDGLAQNEQIYSMRFDRDRGYMVTFRQVDPLFTLDLSDPYNPRVAGEIKVNGFATYIHLIGENNSRLLTIGRSANANGVVTGNKLQLFDVSDAAAPKLVGDYELGAGWSDALYDYHSFLYYQPMGLLAIPYYGYEAGQGGFRVFTVDDAGIAYRGVVGEASDYPGYPERAVIIGDYIYTIARTAVTVADASGLDVRKTVQFPEGY